MAVSCDAKLERAKTLGAEAGINYRTTPNGRSRRALTADRGFDHIVQLGGERTLPQPLRYIRPGGTLSMIGVLSGARLAAPLGLVVTAWDVCKALALAAAMASRRCCVRSTSIGSRR